MFAINVKLQKYPIIFIITLTFLYSCANIQPPSGGPKDTEPPYVKDFYPQNKTLNYNEDFVEIEFSEWVNRNLVVQNILISPISDITYKWNGKKLKINFESTKRENTTYLVSLGTEWTDQAGNKPDSAFSFTFSTGNIIDLGKIEGFVYGSKIAGTYVYAYRIDNKNPDTLNPEITPAEYRTQLGANGSFSLLALPDGTYRIMAVKTPYKDNLFHPKTDEFGTFWENIVVKNGSSKYITMKLGKHPDNSPINLNTIYKIDSNKLLLEFNKLVRIISNNLDFIEIQDSINLRDIPIKLIYLDSIFSKRLFIKTLVNLNNISTVKIKIKPSLLTDTLDFKNNTIDGYYKINYRNYDIPFQFNRIPIKDSTTKIENIDELIFSFNSYFSILDSSFIQIINSNSHQKVVHSLKIDGNALIVKFEDKLMPDEWYKLIINTSKIISIDDKTLADTTLVFHFKTADWRQFPKVSGKLLDSVGCNHITIQLKSNQSSKIFQTSIAKSGNWAIDEVQPDKYSIEVFCDENNNGQYDYGMAFPYKYAEKFMFTKQELEVKPRWEVQNVLLLFQLP